MPKQQAAGNTPEAVAAEVLHSAQLAAQEVVSHSVVAAVSRHSEVVAVVSRHSEVEAAVSRHSEVAAAVSRHWEAEVVAVYFQTVVAAAECCRRLAYQSFVFPRNLRPVMPEPIDCCGSVAANCHWAMH